MGLIPITDDQRSTRQSVMVKKNSLNAQIETERQTARAAAKAARAKGKAKAKAVGAVAAMVTQDESSSDDQA